MFTCPICGGDFLIEDSCACDRCRKHVCPDCISNQQLAPDDFESVCKICLDRDE